MGDWNSVQYLMFKNERTQPAIDLVNRILLGIPKGLLILAVVQEIAHRS